jgi:hypothetical protein
MGKLNRKLKQAKRRAKNARERRRSSCGHWFSEHPEWPEGLGEAEPLVLPAVGTVRPTTEKLLFGTITRLLDSSDRVTAARYFTSQKVQLELLVFDWVSMSGSDQWTGGGLSESYASTSESYANGEWEYWGWDDHSVSGRCTPEEWIRRRYQEVVRNDLFFVRRDVVCLGLEKRSDADLDRALR